MIFELLNDGRGPEAMAILDSTNRVIEIHLMPGKCTDKRIVF
jgi:hypothetical protein